MSKIWIIDRFEGDLAVLEEESGGHIDVNRSLLSENAAEGDVLELVGDRYVKNNALTDERRKRILRKSKRLFEKRESEGQ